ncbi:MAG: glycosyltransferase family 2 protein, partial [Microcystis panniformis]
MTDFQLTTPVAFLIFNRPDTTARVFEAIRQAKPPKLLVVADGPRPDRADDIEKCKAARAVIEGVDWDCEVLKNYSDLNLGCGKRPATGITWVFEQVEEAIILEDDCLPHATFFRFCEELLNYYRQDERIMVISGNNFQFGRNRTDYSYYFSRYNHIWGWASWRRAWQYFDYDLKLWPKIRKENWLTSILENRKVVKYWTKNFQRTYEGDPTVWDYRWTFACWIQNGLTILPNHNLVSNIGFGEDATHTIGSKSRVANLPVKEMNFPLKHPPFLLR